MPPRRTIAREVTIEGAGLHEGLVARLALRPAPAGTGVRVRRVDVEGSEPIPVHVTRREERPRRTALVGGGGAEIHTIEHLMAAVSGLGVTDLEIEVDRIEMPGMDGSARAFAEAIRDAGTKDLGGEAPVLRLDRVVEVADKSGARIVAMPCPGRLVLDYTLDYGGDCPLSRVELEVTEDTFAEALAPARTFCLEKEALMLKAAGLGRGASTQNTLVIGKDGLPLENKLRFADEYARHKALDLLGDLALLGMRLEARVVAYKAGHALNAALVRTLISSTENTESTEARLLASDKTIGERDSVGSVPSVLEKTGFDAAVTAGHFPGDPVVPGIALLAAMRGGAEIEAYESAKFRRIVRPGESLSVERSGEGRVKAKALTASGDVAAEAVLVERKP